MKPFVISTFGDIAIAIGAAYHKYLQGVMMLLEQASASTVDKVRGLGDRGRTVSRAPG